MSKLASALGEKYQKNRLSVMTRTFELGNHTFKVRVPSVGEIERVYNYFKTPNADDVEKEFKLLSRIYNAADKTFLVETLDDEGNLVSSEWKPIPEEAAIEFTENDILLEGRSLRETARNKSVLKYRITEYFKLLIPEAGDLDDLEYEDIEIEFPLPVQLQMMDKISEVISPEYKEVRGK